MSKKLSNVVIILLVVLSALSRANVVQLPPLVPWFFVVVLMVLAIWPMFQSDSLNQYHEYVFQPLQPDDLSPETCQFFDRHEAEFLDLDGEPLGDVRLRTTPFVHDIRAFQSADGTAFGTIEMTTKDRNVLVQCLGCCSVFEDGTYLETTSLIQGECPPPLPEPEDQMKWVLVPNGSTEDVYQRHQEQLQKHFAETGVVPLVFAPEDHADVITYGHRLHWQWRYRRGLATQRPPEPTMPRSRDLSAV